MDQKLCRWGILGTATISQKNWQAIHLSGNGTVVAVASRNPERAQEYIQARQQECPMLVAPDACNYEELINHPHVDAVYIPLPTGLRKEWVIAAARAGKHVVCEKPCASSAADLEEMLSVCRENGVQFMDGVMFMHSDRLNALRTTLDDGESVGKLKRIASQFSFCAPQEFFENNIRTSHELEPFGCLGDLGWYCIRFALWTMNYQSPRAVTGRILAEHQNPGDPVGVPTEFSGELFFDGDVSASFYCSFLTENQQWANLSGTKGYLQLSDFVLPYFGNEVSFDVVKDVFNVQGCQFDMEHSSRRVSVQEESNNTPNSQEVKLFRSFSENVLSGQIDNQWGEIALQTQKVMEACLQSARQQSSPVSLLS